MSIPTVLEKILARKAEEVAARRAVVSLAEVEREAVSYTHLTLPTTPYV